MLVLPSEREGFGLVVAEAQACGTVPVVVSGSDNASVDLIEHGETGIVAAPNAAALAQAISQLLRDEAWRSSLGHKASGLSTLRDWDRTAASTSELFRALTRKRAIQPAAMQSGTAVEGVGSVDLGI
jgi:glycosyltransferase involved in cell wall biosynthesis